jgi:hypothetical protein
MARAAELAIAPQPEGDVAEQHRAEDDDEEQRHWSPEGYAHQPAESRLAARV